MMRTDPHARPLSRPRVRAPRRARLPAVLLALAATVLLGGCSLLGGGERDPITIYAPQMRTQPDPAWPQVQWQLAVAKPSASRLVDSPRIGVRPLPGELQVYKGAVWAQPPTDLLEAGVLRTLEDSGKIAAVGRVATGLRADYRLALDIRRFEADYAGGDRPQATIEVVAKLLHNSDQRVVASRTFLQSPAATATDIGSVAAAFDQALSTMSAEIAGWTLRQGQDDAAAHPPLAPVRIAAPR